MKLFYSLRTKIIVGSVSIWGRWENAQTRTTYKIRIKYAVYGIDVHTGRRGSVNKEREVDKITIHYDDGEGKTVEKGFFCNMKEENGEMVLEFTMCHVAGIELEAIVYGCVQLGLKLGMFDNRKEEE